VTSATRPASPWSGCEIVETDTANVYIWDGSAWRFEMCLDKGPYAMAAGTQTIVFGTGSTGSSTVTFPASRFTQPPIVTATAGSDSGTTSDIRKAQISAISITAAQFTMKVSTIDATAFASQTLTFKWIAVQMTPTSGAG
jgi:hypothetical protein